MITAWWCSDLDARTLISNVLVLAPWTGSQEARKVLALDIDTTTFRPEDNGVIWQIGMSAAYSHPARLEYIDVQRNMRIKVPTGSFVGSLEAQRRAAHMNGDEAAACAALDAESEELGVDIGEAMGRIKEYAQRGDIVLCSQTLTTFDIPWMEKNGGPWLNTVRNIFDTGMFLKSAAIPTTVLPGEIDVQFYERIDSRAMPMRYSVDGFVLPKLSSVGMIKVPHGAPGTPEWRNAGFDSYASLRMMQEIRQMCYQFVTEVSSGAYANS